ncbi:MAG TPA: hypothetical protein PLR41_13630 [Alphaproteobacteria bacterium]|nr:hypothetical protein [Alphaproteobacteria bacterium]
MNVDMRHLPRRMGAVIGIATLAAVLVFALALADWRMAGASDPRAAIAAGFRAGALSIDPVEDRWIGPRRGFDCALLQAGLPGEAETPLLTLSRYADPRDLAEDCEILRDLAVRDPVARYQSDGGAGDVALGHGMLGALLASVPLSLLRWGIVGLWLAAPLLGRALAGGGAVRDLADPAGLLFGPLLAGACLWLWGPSLSAALPVGLLLAMTGWAGASAAFRAGSGWAQLAAAVFGAALALSEYRAPVTCCGFAVLLFFMLRGGKAAGDRLAPVAAFVLSGILALGLCDVAAALSGDNMAGAVIEALLDRLDPAADPIDPTLIKSTIFDAIDVALPGPRSLATLAFLALAFGLLFAPALARASQRAPMPVGRAYAALAGLAAIAAWVAWFGGRSALAPAEGGILYAWLAAASAVSVLHWLWSLALLLAPRRAGAASAA